MQKKLKLNIESDDDYTLIGVVSHLKDYRLIWFINEKLHLQMVKMVDLRIFQDKKNEFNTFSMFYYDFPETFKTYYLIANNGEKGPLFPEHKQTEYFILIKGNVTEEQQNELVRSLYTIVNVLTVHSISLSSIKNIENFFSDLELHMLEISKKNKKTKD